MRFTARLLILCLSLLSLPSFAAALGNLYQVHEPVASQQPDERSAGLSRALQTLVLRLTGDPRAIQSGALAGYFKDPQQLISQYGYENGPPLALVVDFDPTSVNNALRQAGLPVWGANRPSLLAWWLNESAAGSSLVGDSQEGAAPLNRAAQRRGLPLLLPMADLSEQGVGTAQNITAAQPDALRAASERYSADGLLAVTPYYNKTTQGGLVAHFKAIAEAVHTPVILYNVPSRTGLNMKAEAVAALAGVPNIHAVKEASGDLAQVTEIARLTAGRLALYSGADEINLPILACGGVGIISVTGNVAPQLCHDLVAKFLSGDIAGARRLQFDSMNLTAALFAETSPMPLKAALQMLGICTDEVRLPLVPACDATRLRLKEAMGALGLL